MQQIPHRFESAQQYAKVFEPMLREEFRAQVARGVAEAGICSLLQFIPPPPRNITIAL